ncbi:hypothetical protein ZWY2020_049012 [Hordeum vulgare]|nr:hypothetical protein ZWY2020_049012 [Hordeum vulgare]
MVHAVLVLLAWHPDLIMPTLMLHVAAVGIWKYQPCSRAATAVVRSVHGGGADRSKVHGGRLSFRVFHWIAPLLPATLFGIGTVSSSPSSAPCLLSPVALMILVAFEPRLWCGFMAIVPWLSG